MTRDELKNTAYAELTEQGYLPTSKIDRVAAVDVVVDVVEPLIRADERDTVTSVAAEMMNEAWTNLRAKVAALPGAYIAAGVWENPPVTHDIDNWDGKPVVLRADVLALLDGGSDGA